MSSKYCIDFESETEEEKLIMVQSVREHVTMSKLLESEEDGAKR